MCDLSDTNLSWPCIEGLQTTKQLQGKDTKQLPTLI